MLRLLKIDTEAAEQHFTALAQGEPFVGSNHNTYHRDLLNLLVPVLVQPTVRRKHVHVETSETPRSFIDPLA